jgi:hypothetical protein
MLRSLLVLHWFSHPSLRTRHIITFAVCYALPLLLMSSASHIRCSGPTESGRRSMKAAQL